MFVLQDPVIPVAIEIGCRSSHTRLPKGYKSRPDVSTDNVAVLIKTCDRVHYPLLISPSFTVRLNCKWIPDALLRFC
jgi:hypothetical protein